MSIIVHGATHTTNFGDVLFAYLFYQTCIDLGCDVEFLNLPKFRVSEFCKNELNYKNEHHFLKQLKSDGLIMMSGGYLGDDKVSMKNSLKRYLHYILPARLFEMRNRPVFFIGVGGGPLNSRALRKACVRVLNKASYVSVRDIETKNYFLEYGVKKEIVVTTDTAQIIDSRFTNEHGIALGDLHFDENRKYIFYHVVNKSVEDRKMADTISLALNRFLEEHEEYDVIIGCDEKANASNLLSYVSVNDERKQAFEYGSVFQLCCLLDKVHFVITPKLHVGIVSASLGKSVISFPIHREKTERYYRQIGEQDRSVHLNSITEEIAFQQMEKYYEKPITLDQSVKKMAEDNLASVRNIVMNIQGANWRM